MSHIQLPSGSSCGVPIKAALENGDVLDCFEFERRWLATPHLRFAELINGIVCTNPTLKHRFQAKRNSLLGYWATSYAIWTPGVELGNNTLLRLDQANELQPDRTLFLPNELGGTAVIAGGYVNGAPDLVAEFSRSSARRDWPQRQEAYRVNGVREYLAWRVHERQFDWFVLHHGNYVPLEAGTDRIIRSQVFAGLWLDPVALIEQQVTKLLEALMRGLESSEHAAFVEKLKAAPTKPDQPT